MKANGKIQETKLFQKPMPDYGREDRNYDKVAQ
jgi:hypothetical protein